MDIFVSIDLIACIYKVAFYILVERQPLKQVKGSMAENQLNNYAPKKDYFSECLCWQARFYPVLFPSALSAQAFTGSQLSLGIAFSAGECGSGSAAI